MARVGELRLPSAHRPRERGREREREGEGPRLRVATVRSGAPRSQAAGCLVRLQLPRSPSTRAGRGLWPPFLGMGVNKSGISHSKRDKFSSSLNWFPPGRALAPSPGSCTALARARRPARVPSIRAPSAICRLPWPWLRSFRAGSRASRMKILGGVGRAAGDARGAARSRLRSHTAIR